MPGQSSRSHQYLSLDIWRGVACLGVVVFHSLGRLAGPDIGDQFIRNDSSNVWELLVFIGSRMWIGVPLFFVVSGYCISASAESVRLTHYSGVEFLKRRFRRIFPPFWAANIFLALMMGLTEFMGFRDLYSFGHRSIVLPQNLSLMHWILNLSLTDWIFFQTGETAFLYQAWTLVYEVQFYFAAAVIMIWFPQKFFKIAGIITVVELGIVSFGFDQAFYHLMDGRWLPFSAGILVYYAVNCASKQERRIAKFILCVAMMWNFFYGWTSLSQLKYAQSERWVAFPFALLLIVLHGWDGVLTNSHLLSPFRLVGRASYSIYLIHMPIVVAVATCMFRLGRGSYKDTCLLTIPLSIALSILAGTVFYFLVERRFLGHGGLVDREKNHRSSVVSRLL